jgi:hypothetical protein
LGRADLRESDSDFPVESAARFPPILGLYVRIRSRAEGDDGDGDRDGDVMVMVAVIVSVLARSGNDLPIRLTVSTTLLPQT